MEFFQYMKIIAGNIILLCCLLFQSVLLNAQQQGVYVPKKGKVYFSADTSTIFSNVINHGKLGLGKDAVVNFKGKRWENSADAQITDATNGGEGINGVGGLIRFIADSMRQQLVGGYNAATKTGASFYNLQVQNAAGLELMDGNAKVRNEITLSGGLVYLNENILSIGHNNPGVIKGYSEARYFVTNNSSGNSALVRENIKSANGIVPFPIGTSSGYTPAAIKSNSSKGDDYYANVFDGTKSKLYTGLDLSAKGVKKTWELGKIYRPNEDGVEVYLQHLDKDEGTQFTAAKSNSYVAQYEAENWDEVYPQSFPGPGFLTSGAVQSNSGLNKRELKALSTRSYFTKLAGKGSVIKTNLWFNAYRVDKDRVRVLWKTNPEVNVDYFVVQRRLANETIFSNLDTVASKAINNISTTGLDYTTFDNNGYTGVSFYRLLMKFKGNDSVYSRIVAVGAKQGPYNVMLWPNPTLDRFYVALNTTLPVKTLVIYNVLGQKMYEVNVEGISVVEVKGHHLRPGTYFVTLYGNTGTVLETKKLIIGSQ